MATQQTTANLDMTQAIKGLVVNPHDARFAAAINEEASTELPFGVAVKQGTNEKDAKAFTVATETLKGVVVRSQAFAIDSELGDTGIKADVVFDVLIKGLIWVHSEEAVAPGDAVRIRAVASGGEQAGDFRKTADDTTDCIDISKLAKWRSKTTGAGLALLEIDCSLSAHAVADS